MSGKNFIPDRSLKTPLYIQLYDHYREKILSGRLADGERLPSRRLLVKEAGISKATVDNAYQLLEREGLIYSQPKSGFFVRSFSPVTRDIGEQDYYSNPGIVINMSHQGIDAASMPTTALSRLFRNFSYDMPSLFFFGHKYGEEEMRRAVSKLLYKLYGAEASPERIIIGAGTEYLLEQLVHILPKETVFGFENPAFARSYMPVKNAGAKVTLIDSSPALFPQQALLNSDINVLYISPESMFPFNRRLSMEQRRSVLNWADSASDRFIIEAGFDCDFAEEPYPPLLSESKKDNIIYMGTFFRSLAPSIRISYMVLPKRLKTLFDNSLPYYTCLASRIGQRVIAEYINTNSYSRHIKALRRIYAKKRSLLISELEASALKDIVNIYNAESGTYFLLEVNNGEDRASLLSSAACCGVKLMAVSACLIRPSDKTPENLFTAGFGELNDEQIKDAVKRLEKAWIKK